MEWAQILVLILSVFLALFLFFGIVLVILLIKVTNQIRSVTESAQRTALKFEGVANSAAKFASPIALAKLVSSFIKKSK